MAGPTSRQARKYFTVAEANATLPLVRAIVRDITELYRTLCERRERLGRVQAAPRDSLGEAWQEELEQIEAAQERDLEKLQECVSELQRLGIELKDYRLGLVDFPSLREGREVYLCWRLGEAEVAYWHELDAGYAGRQKITPEMYRQRVGNGCES
jgi:hypothetical protein